MEAVSARRAGTVILRREYREEERREETTICMTGWMKLKEYFGFAAFKGNQEAVYTNGTGPGILLCRRLQAEAKAFAISCLLSSWRGGHDFPAYRPYEIRRMPCALLASTRVSPISSTPPSINRPSIRCGKMCLPARPNCLFRSRFAMKEEKHPFS